MALCVFDRRWQYWLLPLISLPLVGEVLRHYLDPIYMSAFTVPPAVAVLEPLALIIIEQRRKQDSSDLARSPVFFLIVAGAVFGFVAANGEAGFNRDGQYCWEAAPTSSGDCWLNPFLVASTFLGYAALPIAVLGPLPALWLVLKYRRR